MSFTFYFPKALSTAYSSNLDFRIRDISLYSCPCRRKYLAVGDLWRHSKKAWAHRASCSVILHCLNHLVWGALPQDLPFSIGDNSFIRLNSNVCRWQSLRRNTSSPWMPKCSILPFPPPVNRVVDHTDCHRAILSSIQFQSKRERILDRSCWVVTKGE